MYRELQSQDTTDGLEPRQNKRKTKIKNGLQGLQSKNKQKEGLGPYKALELGTSIKWTEGQQRNKPLTRDHRDKTAQKGTTERTGLEAQQKSENHKA